MEPGLFIRNARSSYDPSTLRSNNILATVTVDIGRFSPRFSDVICKLAKDQKLLVGAVGAVLIGVLPETA